MLEWDGQKDGAFYVFGETVWIDALDEIAKRHKVGTAVRHMGTANVPAVGT